MLFAFAIKHSLFVHSFFTVPGFYKLWIMSAQLHQAAGDVSAARLAYKTGVKKVSSFSCCCVLLSNVYTSISRSFRFVAQTHPSLFCPLALFLCSVPTPCRCGCATMLLRLLVPFTFTTREHQSHFLSDIFSPSLVSGCRAAVAVLRDAGDANRN
jgi:hypothetical protein